MKNINCDDIRVSMAPTLIRCPKCNNYCEFAEGRLFGYCNKCGSKLERDASNNVSVYDKSTEEDEMLQFAWERFDSCSAMVVPTRSTHDMESLNYEIERMMDEFMTFTEVLKDISTEMQSMDEERKFRVCGICFDMSDRLFMQFEQFLKEYNDFGMYDEMKAVHDYYSSELQKLSSDFVAKQKAAANKYWADKPEEYERLTKELNKALDERSKIAFFDFQKKWELDAEIERLQTELSRTS